MTLKGRKTYLTALAMIVGTVINTLLANNLDIAATLGALDWSTIGTALGLMTLRAGIAKGPNGGKT